MAGDGVSNDGGPGGPSGVDSSRDTGGVNDTDAADVSSATDAVDSADVDAEADAIAGPDDDGYEAAAPTGVDGDDVAVDEAAEEAAIDDAADVDEAKRAEEAALEAALAANPAAPLANPDLSRADLDAHLQGLTTPELTGVVKGVDQPEMGYGEKVTEQGWEALRAEVDARFERAREEEDWANPDLAELSVETVRQRDFGGLGPSQAERDYRTIASGFTGISADPAAMEVSAKLEHATRLEQYQIMGDMPVTEMTNRQLIDSVAGANGLRTAGNIMSVAGIPGLVAGMMAEGKVNERTTELAARLEDGRITNIDPNLGEVNNTTRVVGGVVAAAEIAAMAHPKSWAGGMFDAVRAAFRRGDDVASALNKTFTNVPVGELRAPNAARHFVDRIGPKSWTKGTNTVVENPQLVADDVAAIRRGEGVIDGDRITINGRTYGAHDGTLFPVEGPGFHQLDRGGFKAIQEIKRAGSLEGAQQALDGMGIPQATRELAARLLGLN
ncbi:MAG: hypothetical protein RMA76_13110 [Deltaproteobacteria bacterium]|jgi:hypothetical protein